MHGQIILAVVFIVVDKNYRSINILVYPIYNISRKRSEIPKQQLYEKNNSAYCLAC